MPLKTQSEEFLNIFSMDTGADMHKHSFAQNGLLHRVENHNCQLLLADDRCMFCTLSGLV